MKHPHYENMKLYLEDAAKTDKPWLLWECWHNDGGTRSTLAAEPRWLAEYEYRRIPQTIRIGEHEVPKPVSEEPAGCAWYYVADPAVHDLCWHADARDASGRLQVYLARGLVHLTREAAIAHAKALIAISGGQYV